MSYITALSLNTLKSLCASSRMHAVLVSNTRSMHAVMVAPRALLTLTCVDRMRQKAHQGKSFLLACTQKSERKAGNGRSAGQEQAVFSVGCIHMVGRGPAELPHSFQTGITIKSNSSSKIEASGLHCCAVLHCVQHTAPCRVRGSHATRENFPVN